MTTFRKQGRYNTEDPQELKRQLVALENAVESALKALEMATHRRGPVVHVHSGETVNALVGGYYKCDTSLGDITLILERPTQDIANTFLVVEKTSSSNDVHLFPVDALIDDAQSISLTTKSAYDVFCNGESYRREF